MHATASHLLGSALTDRNEPASSTASDGIAYQAAGTGSFFEPIPLASANDAAGDASKADSVSMATSPMQDDLAGITNSDRPAQDDLATTHKGEPPGQGDSSTLADADPPAQHSVAAIASSDEPGSGEFSALAQRETAPDDPTGSSPVDTPWADILPNPRSVAASATGPRTA
jgi:hypothetical protein